MEFPTAATKIVSETASVLGLRVGSGNWNGRHGIRGFQEQGLDLLTIGLAAGLLRATRIPPLLVYFGRRTTRAGLDTDLHQ